MNLHMNSNKMYTVDTVCMYGEEDCCFKRKNNIIISSSSRPVIPTLLSAVSSHPAAPAR